MKRTASARWQGGLKDGQGVLNAPSGILKATPYSFRTRFEDHPGTNPEELVAAAHAGCYSMALSADLGNAGFPPQSVETTCTITFEPVNGKPTITASHLEVVAKIPGLDAARFQEFASGAKAGCPISRLLNTPITMNARLEA